MRTPPDRPPFERHGDLAIDYALIGIGLAAGLIGLVYLVLT
jgi:hypothetical protein